MNILPTVFIFLLLIALSAHSLISEALQIKREMHFTQGFFNSHRDSMAQFEKKRYNNERKKLVPKQESTTTHEGKEKPFASVREKKPLYDVSKLDIKLLLSDEANPFLYEVAAKLFRILYSHASFYTKDLEYTVLDQIISQKKKKSFEEMLPSDSPIFYKILSGTTAYDIKKKEGYPPFEDFFTLDSPSHNKPVCFRHASIPLLQALTNEKVTAKILTEEQKKWEKERKQHKLLKDELTQFMTQGGLNVTEINTITEYSPKKASLNLSIGVDPDSGINMRKKHAPITKSLDES